MNRQKFALRSKHGTGLFSGMFRGFVLLIAAISALIMSGCSTMPYEQPIQRIKPVEAMRPCECLQYAESGDPHEVARVHTANMECFAICEDRRATLTGWIARSY